MLRTLLLLGLPAGLVACGVSDLPINALDGGDGSAEDSFVDSKDAADTGMGGDASEIGSDATTSDAAQLDAAADEATWLDEAAPPANLCPYSDWTSDGCAPVCGTGNFGPGGLLDGGPDQGLIDVVRALSVVDVADGVAAVTADGTVFHGRAVSGQTQWELLLSVPSPVSSDGYLTYTLFAPTGSNQSPVDTTNITLTFDGKTLVFPNANNNGFAQASLQGTVIGPVDDKPFAAVNKAIPTGGATVEVSTVTPDGLSLYYNVGSAPDPSQDGIYVATRTATDQPFQAGSLLPADIQAAFMGISAVSVDGLTGFFTDWNWNQHVVFRASASDPWSAAGAGPAMPNNFGAHPTADCRFLFTDCSGGGSYQTEICMLPRL